MLDKYRNLRIGKIPLYLIIVIFVFFLAVLQDYLTSRIQHTGFYLSESLLYNMFWVFFIPITIVAHRLLKMIRPNNSIVIVILHFGIGMSLSLLHILVFSTLFTSVSKMVFTPPHHFSNIFNAALSNQFYIAVLWYVIFPGILFLKSQKTNSTSSYPDKIMLKTGSKIKSIPATSIQFIATDKPYTIVYTNDQKILDNKNLKDFESILDPKIFLRVHRSTIINVHCIKEMKSRSNGDYDATLETGQVVRLSRHYRENWKKLLQ